MIEKIPPSHQDLLFNETKAFADLVTLMEDGSPQVTPIWFNTDEKYILVNSAEGRVKDRNMRARPRVALLIVDPKNPYRYLQIRGRVIEIAREGAEAHIHALNLKYHEKPRYEGLAPGMVRVTYKIQPEHVTASG